MPEISLGLVGTGNAAEYHARYAALTPGFRMQSVTSRDKRRAQTFALRHGIPKAFDDIEYLMAEEDVDFLVIANETSYHFRLAQDAFERGLGVLVETPCARTLRETKALVETAEEEGAFLFTLNPLLDMPAVQYLKEVLSKDSLGKLSSFTLELSLGRPLSRLGYDGWRSNPSLSGGTYLEDCSLALDVLSYLMGYLVFQEGEERADGCQLRLLRGDTCCLVAIRTEPQKYLRLQLTGRAGSITICNNTVEEMTGNACTVTLPETMRHQEKTLFAPHDYLGKTYQRILRSITSGEELDSSFERILHVAFIMENWRFVKK